MVEIGAHSLSGVGRAFLPGSTGLETRATRSAADLDGLRAPAGKESPKAKDARLWKVAESFEAVLMRQMLSAMRQGELGNDLLGSSHSSKMVRDMYDDQIADKVAEGDRGGLARVLHDELVRLESDDRDQAKADVERQKAGGRPTGIRLSEERSTHAAIPLQPEKDKGLPIQHREGIAFPRRDLGGILLPPRKPEVKEPEGAADNSE